MNLDERWIYAAAAIFCGFALGALLAAVSRRALGQRRRRPAVRAIAGPTATFLFWLAVAAGAVTAIGFSSPDTLRPIPSDVLAWLPGALAAGLIMLAAYAGGGALSAAAGSAVEQATGRRPVMMERSIRWVIMAAATVLALGNLGVETTSLQIFIAAAAGAVGIAFALLAALGGQSVASNIASGRTLRSDLRIGEQIRVGDVDGTISAIRPAVAIVETTSGRTVIPLALLLEQPFHLSSPDATDDRDET